METLTLNISGKIFVTRRKTLGRFPGTRLARLKEDSREYDRDRKEFFFDRNYKVVLSILDLYRTGHLHLPTSLCGEAISRELKFWEIPEELVSECCWKKISSSRENLKVIDTLDLSDSNSSPVDQNSKLTVTGKIWLTMENSTFSRAAKIWNGIYISAILLTILNFCAMSYPRFRNMMSEIDSNITETKSPFVDPAYWNLYLLEIIFLCFFAMELSVRFTVCPTKSAFFRKFSNLLDLGLVLDLSIVLVMERFLPSSLENSYRARICLVILRLCTSMRIFRIVTVVKRYESMKLMFLTFKASSRELLLLTIAVTIAAVIFASLVFTVEMLSQSTEFESIPIAMWWAIITMTTVGYGDYYPKSAIGKVVGNVCAVSGLLLLALPIAVIATNFSILHGNMSAREQRRRRKKYELQHRDIVCLKEKVNASIRNQTKKSSLHVERQKINVLKEQPDEKRLPGCVGEEECYSPFEPASGGNQCLRRF